MPNYLPLSLENDWPSCIFLLSLACLDSPVPGTRKRQIIEKEDISLAGSACHSLSQLKLLSMALELMLNLLILLSVLQIYAMCITKGYAETFLELRMWLTKSTRLNQSMRLPLCCGLRYLNSEADIANAR